jgi:hypothetical protein
VHLLPKNEELKMGLDVGYLGKFWIKNPREIGAISTFLPIQ